MQLINVKCLDYLVVGSDSGRISILAYNTQKNIFEKVSIFIVLHYDRITDFRFMRKHLVKVVADELFLDSILVLILKGAHA